MVPRLVAALLGVSAFQPPANDDVSLDSPEVRAVREMFGGQLTPNPTTQTRWFLRQIEEAAHEADAGNLQRPAQLWNECQSDGIVSGVLSTRTAGVIALPKVFRGDPEIVAALQYGSESVRSVFDEMFPPAELAALSADGIGLGVAVGELVPVEGRDFPVLVRHNPEFLFYRWTENQWYLKTLAGPIPITPGDGRWMLFIFGGRMAPWRNGLWRAIGTAWVQKVHANLHDQNWQAKLANPARVAYSPQGSTDEQAESWFQKVMAWGVNTVFGLKPGYEVKLLESNGRGHESFEATIKRSDREFVVCIAGQEVTTTGGTGFANAGVFQAIRGDLIKSTADAVAYTINTQGLPMFVVNRWGAEALARCPCVAYQTEQPKDLVQLGAALQGAANGLKSLRELFDGSGREIDLDEYAARFGVALKKTEASREAPVRLVA